jgi:malate permease and related proteins
MLQALIGALTPVFLLITLGIILSKKTHWLDNPSLGTLVSSIGVPALLLNSVLSMNMDVLGMGKLVGTTVLILALVALLSWGFLRLLGHSPRFICHHWLIPIPVTSVFQSVMRCLVTKGWPLPW